MRILVSTTARVSHFRPLLPFVAASVAAGHRIAVAAPRSVGAHVAGAGLRLLPFDDITAAEFAALRHVAGADRSPGRPGGLQLLTAHSARAALPGLRAAVEAYRPDLIVRNTAELAALVVARTPGIAEMPVLTTLHHWMRELVTTSVPVLEMLADRSIAPAAADAITSPTAR